MTPYLELFSSADRERVVQCLKRADSRKEELEVFLKAGNSCNVESLQIARLRGSNTLLHDTLKVETWNLAIKAVWGFIQENRPPDLEAICEVNRILLGKLPGEPLIRKTKISAEKVFPSPKKVELLLEDFNTQLGPILEHEHPLIQATWIYQTLVSIHPFENANGRTSRLAADWVLASKGFPPMVFLSPVAAMVPLDVECKQLDIKSRLTGILRVTGAVGMAVKILTYIVCEKRNALND